MFEKEIVKFMRAVAMVLELIKKDYSSHNQKRDSMERRKNLAVLNGEGRRKCLNIEWMMKKGINQEKVGLDRIEMALVSRRDELIKKEFHNE